jgi:hypothetical protein
LTAAPKFTAGDVRADKQARPALTAYFSEVKDL